MEIVVDGSFEDANHPAVPVTSRGLMYGEGCFETFRMYKSQTFLLKDHLERIQAGLLFLGLSLPDDLKEGSIKSNLKKLLIKNDLQDKDAVIRLQVWREGERGYSSGQPGEMHYSITAGECPDSFSPPKLVTVDTRRIPSTALPSDFKFTNGINYILAVREAEKQGGDDALMQTTDGYISETTKANIFWLRDDVVCTPSAECDILPGITRKITIKLSAEMNMDLKEDKYLPEHLDKADAVWICNSVREILPVKEINNHPFDIHHDFLQQLKSKFEEYRNEHLEKPEA